MSEFSFQEIESGKGQLCNDLLRALPAWFGIEEAILQYVKDVEKLKTFAAYSEGRPIALLSLSQHSEWTAEIHVMAVHPTFHRSGIGRKLTELAMEHLRENGFEFLTVKTLSPARADKNYELTRKFYLGMGFRVVEEFKTLWGSANPCLLLIKAL